MTKVPSLGHEKVVNALQRDMCPSETRFEGEIIAMTLDMLHAEAAGPDASPCGTITSGGTDSHLLLVDVGATGLSGAKAERVLDAVGVYANKNTIPFDERPPLVGSGLRLGTPGLTSRGMGPDEMRRIAGFISQVLANSDDEKVMANVRREVEEMTSAFAAPGITDRMEVKP